MFDRVKYNREWQKNNRIKLNEYMRTYYQKNREKYKQYEKNRRDKAYANRAHRLIQHHTKYKEIDGVDEIIFVTDREHKKIHNELKRNHIQLGTIPPKIVAAAMCRSPNRKKSAKEYQKNFYYFEFQESLEPNVVLRERISYNKLTGNVSVVERFKGNNGCNICFISER